MHVGHEPLQAASDWHWGALVIGICLVSIVLYITAMYISGLRGKPVPLYRLALWSAAMLSAAVSLAGPLAEKAHADFAAHMLAHLLLGMVAPLLAALAAPFSLLYRTISTNAARKLACTLKSRPLRILGDPLLASFLHVGGLWGLYATPVYEAMHHNLLLHLFIHAHFFIAGYLYTVAIIPIDPTPHRTRFAYRAAVLLLASAGHSILAKHLYAHPPKGVPLDQATAGSQLMYYGGDAVGAAMIILFCYQWYRAARPRHVAPPSQSAGSNKRRCMLTHQLPD
ncbi:cytochrome c oxidase assembly protein [Xylanibacillus composti]|uniref:Membrane protein n=1 Tax=Xylanibacillus composti TaxID=1572762 RepID=A0A8J4M1S2_9BACL|nr:cytochrome c oxidase assembly protein [Xylanibacillus composti]MDT9724902.1 cytochrome c oxidase assembly protein [Xylanibacillus composti]GIQ68137.1 membrane protein [Xylanibacillus composti]